MALLEYEIRLSFSSALLLNNYRMSSCIFLKEKLTFTCNLLLALCINHLQKLNGFKMHKILSMALALIAFFLYRKAAQANYFKDFSTSTTKNLVTDYNANNYDNKNDFV